MNPSVLGNHKGAAHATAANGTRGSLELSRPAVVATNLPPALPWQFFFGDGLNLNQAETQHRYN